MVRSVVDAEDEGSVRIDAMTIRKTGDLDRDALRRLHIGAFGDEGAEIVGLVEALLVDETAQPVCSLAAEKDGEVVGHVLFTKVEVGAQSLPARILAPLAVMPGEQGQGLGKRLVEEGLEMLTDAGVALVFVLGHPEYYPRFGFRPAGAQGLDAPYPIPEEHAGAWMVLELQSGAMKGVQGTVRCAAALDEERYWGE